ncbi:MAG: lipoprotein [Actinobacteria bacterium]|nr:lipoprotein [Actinomycetota bacterium]
MKRFASLAVAVAVLAACSLALAAGPKPTSGSWKFTDAPGGFRLTGGKGEQFVTAVHTNTAGAYGCSPTPGPIKVLGRFPLKWVTIPGGYQFWAVGKPGEDPRYQDSSRLISVKAKVFVAGKQVPQGGIKLEFNYERPAEFEVAYIEWGGGKDPGSTLPEPLCVKILEGAHP